MLKSALATIKLTSRLLPRPQISAAAPFYNGCSAASSRSLSVICAPLINTPAVPSSSTLLTSQCLLQPASCLYLPTQSYKVKTSLYKRCNQCYFVRRKGRLFVECKAKGRHKQMQKVSKKKLFRE